MLGGYYLIEAADYDEAVERALDHPHLEYGGNDRSAQVWEIVSRPRRRPESCWSICSGTRRAGWSAHLTRLLGPAHLDLAEETVQEAMLRALQTWPYQGVPENPAAWLFRVAHNAAIDAIRRSRLLGEKTEQRWWRS